MCEWEEEVREGHLQLFRDSGVRERRAVFGLWKSGAGYGKRLYWIKLVIVWCGWNSGVD